MMEEKVAAEQILAEDSDYLMAGSGSILEVYRVGSSDVKKDGVIDVDKEKVFSSQKLGVDLMMNLSSYGFGVSGSDSVIDGRVVLDGSSNVVAARDEKNSDGDDFSCIEIVASDGKRGKERRTINLNVDVNLDGMGIGRWNGEKLEDQDHGIRVGDFVWLRGRYENDPWWPGQVYDPRDASEFALKHSIEGRVLVALFGDGSCCWCLPSDLIPFVENLDKMYCDSSKSFVNAVQRAVDEISRIVESRITCRCIPLEKRGHLARPVVENFGVKAGVLVPEVDFDRLPIPEDEPSEILAKVLDLARTVSFDSVFELAILKSRISAYSYAKRGGGLCVYSDPIIIEGLEDKDGERKAVVNALFHVPEVDDPSSPNVSSAMSEDKIYLRRKKKSIADLVVKENVVKPRTRKRSVDEVERGLSSRKRAIEGESDDGIQVKLEVEAGYSPRERKKSKYLSPPFTDLIGRMGYLRAHTSSREQDRSAFEFDSETDDETEKERDMTDSEDSWAAENVKKMTFLASDVDLDVHELCSKLESAAVDCFYLRREDHLDCVWAFISAYRSSIYLHGSDNKVFHKCKKVSHKRKSPPPSSSRPRGCTPKISSPRKHPAGKRGSSQPTDDLVSDARAISQKLDTVTKMLEKCSSRFSSDDKSDLKDEMKRLMENVDTVSEKVRSMTEDASL